MRILDVVGGRPTAVCTSGRAAAAQPAIPNHQGIAVSFPRTCVKWPSREPGLLRSLVDLR